ncbi:MAG: cyclic nucleotide-binding domain-containing protein [Chloroflexi bacterium]|nr:cyclic nucleotide-binding domain-containing protein [Chloroflexota bacterium]
MRRCRYPATICFQGDAGDGLYIVLRGTVRITIVAPDGQETFLALLGRGDCFGEMAVLDGCVVPRLPRRSSAPTSSSSCARGSAGSSRRIPPPANGSP